MKKVLSYVLLIGALIVMVGCFVETRGPNHHHNGDYDGDDHNRQHDNRNHK